MTTINYQKTYSLGQDYKAIKDRAVKVLGAGSGDTVDFNDVSREVTFRSERLIPSHKERPSVILLFSNPHPHSIRQGMFLSPNTKNPYGGRRVKNKEEIIRTLLGNEWPCLGNDRHQKGMCKNCDDCWHWEGPDSIYETIRNGIQAVESQCAENPSEEAISEAQLNHRKQLASKILGVEVR